MKVLHYTITLLDAVYYAREGLTGAITPPVLHATAVNGALAAATNDIPDLQPLLMSESNGGANLPRYEDSRLTSTFYATPARALGSVRYRIEIAKGENDGFLQIQSRKKSATRPRIDSRELPLRFRKLHFIAPETEFYGFLFLRNEAWNLPDLIRLGSFRTPAKLRWNEAVRWDKLPHPSIADHPVDPLVSQVTRGVMVNMMPYSIVENATTTSAIRVYFSYPPVQQLGREFTVALPDGFEVDSPQRMRVRGEVGII
jgi:CRISPR type I-D-associated protein Csc1